MTDGWSWIQRDEDASLREPFQPPELDQLFMGDSVAKISAAWCISCRDKRLIYFWGSRSFDQKYETDVEGRFGFYIRAFRPLFDLLEAGSGVLLGADKFQHASADPIKYIASVSVGGDHRFDIYAGKEFIFLYQLAPTKGVVNNDSVRKLLMNLSNRGYELGSQAISFFERVPKHILCASQAADRLHNQYFGPVCFEPPYRPSSPFAWPWQRCREMRNGKPHPKEIPTISLVMDIRNSTSAMLRSDDAAGFSTFIDDVVEGARETITRNGGFFDKDTGDGVVGHFEGPADWNEPSPALGQALSAARAISHGTTQLCDKYQEHLGFRLGGLGCGIGLFAGKAVWLYSWRGIRAIGGSIVDAARICESAKAGEVGYCNRIAGLIQSSKMTASVFPLTGTSRQIEHSEIRKEACPEATFVRVN